MKEATYTQTSNILNVTVMPQRSWLLVTTTIAAASDAVEASSRSDALVVTCATVEARIVSTASCDSSSIIFVVIVSGERLQKCSSNDREPEQSRVSLGHAFACIYLPRALHLVLRVLSVRTMFKEFFFLQIIIKKSLFENAGLSRVRRALMSLCVMFENVGTLVLASHLRGRDREFPFLFFEDKIERNIYF